VLKTLASILAPCGQVDDFHDFAVCSLAELLHKLPLLGKTEVLVKAAKSK
jgi:hypothetical protein